VKFNFQVARAKKIMSGAYKKNLDAPLFEKAPRHAPLSSNAPQRLNYLSFFHAQHTRHSQWRPSEQQRVASQHQRANQGHRLHNFSHARTY